MNLKEFLKLSHGNIVRVCRQEPGKCADYWTTLQKGESNIHTDSDLGRKVYSIGLACDEKTDAKILSVYIW